MPKLMKKLMGVGFVSAVLGGLLGFFNPGNFLPSMTANVILGISVVMAIPTLVGLVMKGK